MTGMDPMIRGFRLIPVPMHLDDPRWRSSWGLKPCLVIHASEDLARDAAAQFFKPSRFDAPFGSPWLDTTLVSCSEYQGPSRIAQAELGTVLDLSGGPIEPIPEQDHRTLAWLSTRVGMSVALILIGLNVLLWSLYGPPSQIAQLREQARALVAELLSGPDREFAANPLLLFQASLAEAAPAATTRGSIYVPAYSAIRLMTGRGRVNLATTLSIHNTSRERPLTLQRVDYHNTEGELVQAFLDKPVALKPLGAVEMFVAAEDVRGGSGANFLVEWAADGPITEPVVEAVMIGSIGTTSYSFVSQGRSLDAPR